MMRFTLPLFAGLLLLFSACSTSRSAAKQANNDGLDRLYKMMSGTFSSEQQSIQDSSYFNINLVMHPIWEGQTDYKWLYVEQAVTEYIDRPYRQRVYRLSKAGDNLYESKVYELPQPERFVHGWNTPGVFSSISPDSLLVRQGCAVYVHETSDNCFSGSTKDQDCLSNLRGATYATSEVTICSASVLSWDQGWNESEEQVWGAVKGGYVFQRKE